MSYVLNFQDYILDEFGINLLLDIKKRSAANPPYLFDVLNNPCIKEAIAIYNKLIDLENHDYLELRVDPVDCRVQYVYLRHKGEAVVNGAQE